MKISKRILSCVLAILMVLSASSVGFTATALDSSAGASVLEDIVLETIARPVVDFYCTEITRVAKEALSTEPGNQIVKATPSGVPELEGSYVSQAYAGETPEATRVVFKTQTIGVSVTGFSCSNETVVMTDMSYDAASGMYYVDIVSGMANAGDAITFTVDYKWTDGKTYQEKCVTYVENIVTGGSYAQVKSLFYPYSGSGASNRHFFNYTSASTRLLGKGVYYEQPANLTTSEDDPYKHYGIYDVSKGTYIVNEASGYNTSIFSNEYNPTVRGASIDEIRYEEFIPDVPEAHVYVDASTATTLKDINLRLDSNVADLTYHNGNDAYTAIADIFINSGLVKTKPDSYVNDTTAQAVLGYDIPAKADYGANQYSENTAFETITGRTGQFGHIRTGEFTGKVADIADGSSYTIINKYYSYFYATNNILIKSNLTDVAYVAQPITFHIVDKTVLREAINFVLNSDPTSPVIRNNQKGVNPQAWYYKSGFQAYQTAYIEALRVLNNPKALQTEIDAAAKGLKSSYNGLVLASADYSKVNEYQDIADEILENADAYDAQDIAVLEEAMDMVKSGYNILYQGAVDTMASNLEKAVKITPQAADYTKVDEAIAVFNEKNETIYTPESWKAVEDVIATVDRTLDATQQATVDEYAAEINEAIANLVTVKADFSMLEEAVAKAKTYDYTLYVNGDELVTAIANAQTAIDSNNTSAWDKLRQSEVDALTTALNEIIGNLQLKSADKEALFAAITKVIPGEEAYYDQTILNEYKALVADGEEMYRDSSLTIKDNLTIATKVSQINTKYNELMASYETPADLADKDALKAAIDQTISGVIEYYDQTILAEYNALVAEGQKMYDDATLTSDNQAEINAMTDAINEKYEELMASYEEPVNPANKAELEEAIKSAEAKIATGNYLDGTEMDELNSAIESGKELAADEMLTENDQATIDSAKERILVAAENLKLKSADYTEIDKALVILETLKAETVEVVTYIDAVLGMETKAKYDETEIEAIEAEIVIFKTNDYTIIQQSVVVDFAEAINTKIGAIEAIVYSEYLTVAIEEYDDTDLTPYTAETSEAYTNVYNEAVNLENADQAAINDAVTALANAKSALQISAFFMAKEGTTTVVDKVNGIIYGLEEGIADLEGYVTYEGGVLEYEYTENGFGTGAVVNFVVNGEVKETYTIIIYGDLNGDGAIDNFDYAMLAALANGDIEVSDAVYQAADIEFDGSADNFDLALLGAVTVGATTISQVPVI